MQSILIRTISLLLILFFGLKTDAQDFMSVSGIVTTSGRFPLNKVKISAAKSGENTYTDSVGRFMIKCSEKDALTVTASGFKERKIKTGKQNSIKIDLLFIDDIANFNAAINEGHITEKALQQAIAVSQLKNTKDYSKYISIYELISCEVYNVSVKGTSVYNKKVRSFDSNPQVLYVVDDKIVSDISYLSPIDVKNIEFIDDVGTTMYGSKGANGVIKISLK